MLVQGDDASAMLRDAVIETDQKADSDVIIIGRGGGSIEDLWAFNSEDLARAIFACKIPVISAVGHETDFTICDFVADMRAPTPTAAAEIATPDRFAEMDMLSKQRQYLCALGENLISQREKELSSFTSVLIDKDPRIEFENRQNTISQFYDKLTQSGERILGDKSNELENLKIRLFSLNPSEILKRGYSVVSIDDKTVFSKNELKSNDRVKMIFTDGEVFATVD